MKQSTFNNSMTISDDTVRVDLSFFVENDPSAVSAVI